jgi:hypothetical protein
MLKFKKYTVRRFAPSPVRDFISPCGKFNDIDAKHKQKSAILTVRKLVYDKLFILCRKIYRTVNNFYRTVINISHRTGTCQ